MSLPERLHPYSSNTYDVLESGNAPAGLLDQVNGDVEIIVGCLQQGPEPFAILASQKRGKRVGDILVKREDKAATVDDAAAS